LMVLNSKDFGASGVVLGSLPVRCKWLINCDSQY
jgi:hypothetical protein